MNAHRSITRGSALLFFIALITASTGGSTAAAAATTFSGQAAVISGQVAGIRVTLVDTGPVAATGGSLHQSLLEYPISGVPDPTGGAVTAEVMHATVVAQGNRSSAEATVANFGLTAAGQTIAAELLSARASATCNSGAATITESSEVVGLTVNGQQITVGTAPQTIMLPGVGSIIVNEQPVASASGDEGAVTVNALHIMLTDPLLGTRTDLVVASAHADITCATQPGPGGCLNKDFVTGGGWITRSDARATFAVAGGPGGWGHLQYIDHGSNFKVKGTGVTAYGPGTTGPTSRQIDGTAEWTGGGGTYHVEVADNGEPGRNDTFNLVLSNGYGATGTLDGGNIQLHCD
jgi:hypothetical protein